MPELPDVAAFGRIAEKYGLNKTVRSLILLEPAMAEGVDEETLNRKIAGHRFTGTRRHGKHLFLKSNEGWLALHFGMSGNLEPCGGEGDMPRHTRMLIIYSGDALAYISQRKLGRIEWTRDPAEFIQEKGLGPDALEVAENTFIDLLQKRRGKIKTSLMNQGVLAGLGNIYSDEILFQSGIHPRSAISALNPDDWLDMYRKNRDILPRAEELLFKGDPLPDDWLISHRKKGELCPFCGGELSKERIGGRGSFLCPRCQVLKSA
ncbi:MAG: Fpg/Nei family DNA glycosylase [Desulfurivibrionaceae bacterium]